MSGGGAGVDHTEQVRHWVRVAGGVPEPLRAAAFLHDLVEDGYLTFGDVLRLFDTRTVTIVDALTRRDGESYWGYIQRVARNRDAAVIKCADLRDNLRRMDTTHEHNRGRYIDALDVLDPIATEAGYVGR